MLLHIIPVSSNRSAIELIILVVMLKAPKRIVDGVQLFSNKGQRHPDRRKELHMLPVQAVDVVFTIKSSVHDQIYL